MQAATEFCFSFDFDEWSRLAAADPSAFEARRLALIEEFLGQFPASEQRRLRGLQFHIDMERRRARTPMAACLRLSAMMWDSLLGSEGLKSALDQLLQPASQTPPPLSRPPRPTGRVLPFRRPSR